METSFILGQLLVIKFSHFLNINFFDFLSSFTCVSSYFIGAGNEKGLTLILNSNISDYFCSSTKSCGFKVLMHSPNDLPRVSLYGVAIPNGYESRIAISTTLSTATDAVRKIPKNIRQCLFDDENFLDFYR